MRKDKISGGVVYVKTKRVKSVVCMKKSDCNLHRATII